MTPPGPPRRLLMTADAVGGVWSYALELARGLAAQDVEVLLATMGPPPSPAQCAEAAPLANVRLVVGNFRLEWMESPWAEIAAAGDWLLELEAEFSPDLIHLNGYVHGALPWRAPVLVVGHSCVLSWWEAVRGDAVPTQWIRYREAVRAGLRAAHGIAVPSRAMLGALQRHYGPFAHGQVIPNGRDPRGFTPAAEKEPFILSVGRLWDEAKNVAALAAVAPQLPWPVRVAGKIAAPDGREQVLPNLELLGTCSPAVLADHYGRAAIYALPARYEPFGLSVLEAALSGCALLLGDISSLRELWDGAAEFVPPSDPDALRDRLTHLIGHGRERQELAARARQRALEFSSDRMVRGYLAAYARILARPRAEPPAERSALPVPGSAPATLA